MIDALVEFAYWVSIIVLFLLVFGFCITIRGSGICNCLFIIPWFILWFYGYSVCSFLNDFRLSIAWSI